jgi:RNA 3'-terminal phosphate cyclase (ATP)
MLSIDGSLGEGGGQILRTALALSLVTGIPFRIERIRAARSRPGLLRQHLAAVFAAREIGQADAGEPALHATELEFRPGPVKAGEYRFAVTSAGSACLVVQTVLPPLLLAAGRSVLLVDGGTHNSAAPPWEYLARALFPLLERMGPRLRTTLERHGFYPAGGGRLRVEIEPVARLTPLELLDGGALVGRSARALVARLPLEIGERELRIVSRELPEFAGHAEVVNVTDSAGPGNVLLLELVSERVTEIFAAFGRRGLRAEAVAERAVQQVREYLRHGAPVGPHLADQLVLPLAIAGDGAFRTGPLTGHTRTNLDVVSRFLPVGAEIRAGSGSDFVVRIAARA